ncbi:MAG: radical SAM protein [Acidobacteria bacterium]|nr:MAG: radical SAM protein [Acidobacteriota bacterium]
MKSSSADRRIRDLRPAKDAVDAWNPLGVLVEEERTPDRGLQPSITIFLAGAECPFTCVFCDLWKQTLVGATPEGAIPAQLDAALRQVGTIPPGAGVKLYNASNFFDPRAVPRSDLPAIVERLAPFARVTVECHPRLAGEQALELAALLDGRLEVAMGLETAHPQALLRLNKRMELEDFGRAAALLCPAGIGVRAFVLVGAPFVPTAETVEWAVRSVEYALERGAEVVTLIPVRSGNGELDRLERSGEFVPPTLNQMEAALERALELDRGVVLADMWDIERLIDCPGCGPERVARLERMNLSGRLEDPVGCPQCRVSI